MGAVSEYVYVDESESELHSADAEVSSAELPVRWASRRLNAALAIATFLVVAICGIVASQTSDSTASLRDVISRAEHEKKAGSCKKYGCHDAYAADQDCQCNIACKKFGTCCDDFQATCLEGSIKALSKTKKEGTCQEYGCSDSYRPDNDCQCTPNCDEFENCCIDFVRVCEKETTTTTMLTTQPPATSPKPTTMAPPSVPAPAPAAPAPAPAKGKHDGEPISFYVYRAQSSADYPLENVNVADLAGVLWYLHREVIPATPRKYHIDRIKRFKITMLPTKEFWNVHHGLFGPFFAYDGGRCSDHMCGQFYHQYGFVMGCQFVDTKLAAYYSFDRTSWYCKDHPDECHKAVWYSLPGECPTHGFHNSDLKGNSVSLDVNKAKSPECIAKNPGGRCDKPTGAPDCTYSVEDAGEISLDELAGIPDYEEFWKGSSERCHVEKARGIFKGECVSNKEYVGKLDKGIGCNFWNNRYDKVACQARMQAATALFQKKFPQFPATLPEPVCDFDTFYKGEFTWKLNHTGAVPSPWWDSREPLKHEIIA